MSVGQKARPGWSCRLGIGPQHWWANGGELQQSKMCPTVPSALQISFTRHWRGKQIPGARAELASGGSCLSTPVSWWDCPHAVLLHVAAGLSNIFEDHLASQHVCCFFELLLIEWPKPSRNEVVVQPFSWACFCSSVLFASASHYPVTPG